MSANRRLPVALLALGAGLPMISAAPRPANEDESKVPAYVLPGVLTCADGMRVTDVATWRAKRRPELLETFAREVYGRTPSGRPAGMHWKVTSRDRAAMEGRTTRKEITVWFSRDEEGPRMQLLVYQPNAVQAPPPVFLGLNFLGNHSVDADPGIALPRPWGETGNAPGADRPVREIPRGTQANRWQIGMVIARGYATVTAYRGDLFPDHKEGRPGSAAVLFDGPRPAGRPADDWGAIGVWAWGLSRALDVLLEDPELDARRVVVHGHSRLGKASLWAAAQDERFKAVISNCSGCGGAALSRRVFGETVARINGRFPYWLAPNFRRYDDREADLPVDQHELLALIAPRPLYVASATEDLWADPRGEFLSAREAGPVYALHGRAGLGVADMPAPDHPVGDCVRYHVRSGKHDITAYDWAQYLDFADRWLGRP